eukprot:g3168.t1
MRFLLLSFSAASAAASASSANFSVSAVFGSDMVLQRDVKAAIFGDGLSASATVTVRVDGALAGSATAGAAGDWKVLLEPRPASTGPHTISIASSAPGDGDVVLERVAFGDVFFCSGQLALHYTLTRNQSYTAVAAGRYDHIRTLHFDHNPQPAAVRSVDASVLVAPWQNASAALGSGSLDRFSGACWYFGESLADRMAQHAAVIHEVVATVPIGLIESAFGGTMIESWLPVEAQLACGNITCTVNQTQRFDRASAAACLAAADRDRAAGGGGMGGNALYGDGYACLLPALVGAWRSAWSATPGTTPGDAAFGVVMLADSTDEGWGANVPQMHWAQTANVGHAPNKFLPRVFLAAAHDLADPWDDSCYTDGAGACCADTGKPLDARCDTAHRGFLVQTGQYPGAGAPVTPSMGVTIHPRVKRQVGERLSQAAWRVAYGHVDTASNGPVLAGCAVEAAPGGGQQLRMKFNSTLQGGDGLAVAEYNRTEKASVTWVLLSTAEGGAGGIPQDAGRNWLYENRQPWWGDNDRWVNVDIALDSVDGAVVATLPAGNATVLAVRYGHVSPKGHPQCGHYKICCGDRNFVTDPCAPESCPISSVPASATTANRPLPALPFHARIVGGKCKCLAPQVCDA